jgi:hypothetical protein
VKRTALLATGLWASWLTLGCDESLKSVELVAAPRVLGARVEVLGDAARAAPAPGETATVSFLVAAPELSPSLGFALAACSSAPREGGRSGCAAAPFAQVSSENAAAATASLSFDVPADLDPSLRITVLGIICPDGSPNADGSSCDGADPGTPVTLELELAHADDVNSNPELEADSIGFDGDVWTDLPPLDGDCTGLGFPEVAVKTQHSITVALDASDRDPLPHPDALDAKRESLQLSHFATAGDLTRAFETIAWDSDQLSRKVSWTAPKEPGLVRFWLVLRDFRGGSAFVERAACVQ